MVGFQHSSHLDDCRVSSINAIRGINARNFQTYKTLMSTSPQCISYNV